MELSHALPEVYFRIVRTVLIQWFCIICIASYFVPLISDKEGVAIEIDTKNLLKWNGYVLKDFQSKTSVSIQEKPD